MSALGPIKCFLRNVPEIGNEINTEDLEEAPLRDRVPDTSHPEEDSNVRDDDLAALVRAEHDSSRVEVWEMHQFTARFVHVADYSRFVSLGYRSWPEAFRMRYAGQPPTWERTCQRRHIVAHIGDTHEVTNGTIDSTDGRVAERVPEFLHDLL